MDEDKVDHVYNDEKHWLECHLRWQKNVNRWPDGYDLPEGEVVPENWLYQQCGECKYYIRLIGNYGSSWGACTNVDSEFDCQVKYEHDGCDNHKPAGVFGYRPSNL